MSLFMQLWQSLGRGGLTSGEQLARVSRSQAVKCMDSVRGVLGTAPGVAKKLEELMRVGEGVFSM